MAILVRCLLARVGDSSQSLLSSADTVADYWGPCLQQDIANRQSRTLEISLDDIEEVCFPGLPEECTLPL